MFLKKYIFIFLFMSMLATKVFALELPPMDPSILYGKLDNGLTYYIKKNTTPKKKLALNLVVKAGSLMESEEQLGLAHLLEHMAFNGSKNFPKNSIDTYFNSIGLTLGAHFNASTGFENTNYKFEIPTDKPGAVETAIHILSDIVSNLDLSDAAFDKERKIVEEEWRGDLGIQNRHHEIVGKALFNESLYFYRRPIGNIDSIRNFKNEEGRKYYQDWYQPSSMAVFAVGDIDPKEIEKYITKYFSHIVNTKTVTFPDYSIPDFATNKFVVFKDPKKNYLSFTIFEKRDYVKLNSYENHKIHLIHELAIFIFKKRLQEIVHRENPVVLDSDASLLKISRDNFYHYSFAILQDDKINEGIEELITSIETIRKFGFTQEELDVIKKTILTDYEQGVQEYTTRRSKFFIEEYIRNFTEDENISSSADYLELIKEIYPTITLADVNNYFAQAFNGTNRIIELSVPERITDLPSEADIENIIQKVRSNKLTQASFNINKKQLIPHALTGGEIKHKEYLKELDITKIELSNGATIYLKPTTFKKGSFSFKARSMGGHSKASFEQLPSAKYLDDILDMSNLGEFSITDFNNVLPLDYVDVKPMVGPLFEGYDGDAISKYKEELFQMIYLNYTDRRITQSVVDNYKMQQLEILENSKSLPSFKMAQLLNKSYYQNHPRYLPRTAENINKINLQDLQDVYKDRFGDISDFTFIFVGDFEPSEFEEYAKKYIGSLPATFRKEKFYDHGIRLNKNKETIEIKEANPVKSSQTRFYNKNFANNISNRQIYSLLIDILQEEFVDEIRENLNLVYSISARSFDIAKYPEEVFTLRIDYESSIDNVERINKEIDVILAKIKQGNFDPKLLVEKKMGLINSYKENLNKNTFWTYVLNEYIQNKEPLNNIINVERIINNVTKNDIINLANEIFDENYITASMHLDG